MIIAEFRLHKRTVPIDGGYLPIVGNRLYRNVAPLHAFVITETHIAVALLKSAPQQWVQHQDSRRLSRLG
jgi:hypothetical protein